MFRLPVVSHLPPNERNLSHLGEGFEPCGGMAPTSVVRYLLEDIFLFFLFTFVTGPRRSSSLKLSDTRVCEPQIPARLGATTILRGWMVQACGGSLHISLHRW